MLAPGLPRDMPLPPLVSPCFFCFFFVVYLSVPILVGATQAPTRRANINSIASGLAREIHLSVSYVGNSTINQIEIVTPNGRVVSTFGTGTGDTKALRPSPSLPTSASAKADYK